MFATEFVEGNLDIFSGIWYCTEHGTKMKVGKECAWCVRETLTEAEFDLWLDRS